MSQEPDKPEVMRWFTHALRVPTLIGKPPGGGHYPGGPYSVTQVLGAIGLFVTGQMTMSVWGVWSGLMNNVVLFLASIGTLFALRLVKPGGRNPLAASMAFGSVIVPPLGGKFRGRPIQRRLPHRVRNGQINALVFVPPVKPKASSTIAPTPATSSAPTVDLRKSAPVYAFAEFSTVSTELETSMPATANPEYCPFLPAPRPSRPNPFLCEVPHANNYPSSGEC